MIMRPRATPGTVTAQGTAQRKVVVVDDHPMIRDAVAALIGGLSGWRLVGEASTARDALVLVTAHLPDVVLMDIALPGMDGIIATREVLRRSPTTKVLVLTAHLHPQDVRQAFTAGASGYLLKSDSESLEIALEKVALGGRYLSPSVEALLVADQDEGPTTDALAALSEREKEVFRLAAECLTNRQIARELCISRKTVDTHLYRIHCKLAIRTSAELVRLAVSFGMGYAGRGRGDGADAAVAGPSTARR
jgi:DNA-binding NarL/FixJ family response regulator